MAKIIRYALSAVILSVLVLAAGLIPYVEASPGGINVKINGEAIDFNIGGPVVIDNQIFVPLRSVFETMGFAVSWNIERQQAILVDSNYEIIITIGSEAFSVNSQRHELDIPAQIIGGQTMLPIRAVLESIGYTVYWDIAENAVIISALGGRISQGVTNISAGFNSSYAVLADGSLWFWGQGFIFDWPHNNIYTPEKIMENVVAVSAGHGHKMAIRNDGSLWAWGKNYSGQLGDGTTIDRRNPVKIMENIVAVSAGGDHTLAIRADGSLWAWGFNREGQLGDGTTIDRHSPVKIMEEAAAVSAGGTHTMVIRTDGSLWAFGDNSTGQFGNGTVSDTVPSDEGSWYEFLPNPNPVRIMGGVTAVSAGNGTTLAITADGSGWEWGTTGRRQQFDSGIRDYISTFAIAPRPERLELGIVNTVSAGISHNMVITADGGLWVWGANWHGMIGDGTTVYRESPQRIMDNVAYATAGEWYTIAVQTDGSLWAWGSNIYGQLGDGTNINRHRPVRIMDDIRLTIVR